MVLEAGCKKKKWIYDSKGNAERYEVIASGTLLEERVCIGKNYRNYIAPLGRNTKVHTTIEYQQIRAVDAKEQTVSFDLLLTLRWVDPNIITNFNEHIRNEDGVIIRPVKVDKIWVPDLYIWNRTSLKQKDEWAFLQTSMILTKNELKDEDHNEQTTVELKYEVKTTIYCKFEYSRYPMDSQVCTVRIGSASAAAIFVLNENDRAYHDPTNYGAVGLNLAIEFFDNDSGTNFVGFDIQMDRMLRPFLMKYYIPSIAIVIVSEIAFMVPLTAIPGRVAILVTQFLTLVNLFIYQMVSR